MSSLIFCYAAIVTHSLFRTDSHDININTTSSYLDLSPVYGHSEPIFRFMSSQYISLYVVDQAAQDKVRNKAAGRGLLYPDTFSEDRLTFLPPGASALLVLFSRNHNVNSLITERKQYLTLLYWQYIAERILKINERKKWSDPPPTDEAKRALQDEEIFQTARLVKYAVSFLICLPVVLKCIYLTSCGHFMSSIMGDYVAGFLGSSEGCNWNMKAFDVGF